MIDTSAAKNGTLSSPKLENLPSSFNYRSIYPNPGASIPVHQTQLLDEWATGNESLDRVGVINVLKIEIYKTRETIEWKRKVQHTIVKHQTDQSPMGSAVLPKA